MKWCRRCGDTKPTSAFSVSQRAGDGLQTYCKTCQATAVRTKTAKFREALATVKLHHGCTDCGYRRYAEALDFDHVRGVKLFSPSDATSSRSWAAILAELEKCEVVCANCHRHRTWARRRGVAPHGRPRAYS